jgi:hypothetical protein
MRLSASSARCLSGRARQRTRIMAGVATARMGSVSHAPLPRAMFGATIEEGNMGKEKGPPPKEKKKPKKTKASKPA